MILFVHYTGISRWVGPEVASRQIEHARDELIPDIRNGVKCFQACGNIEWELRSKLLLADLASLTGDEELARAMAQEVLPFAEAYQFDNIAEQATGHINGDPFYRQLLRTNLEGPNADPDNQVAGRTDEEVRNTARRILEGSGLPMDRLPVFEREVQSHRDIGRERLNWCRHIQLIQDLQHTRSRSTSYALDPERYCFCEKFEFRSKISSPDWPVLIRVFKGNYCLSCTARDPKGRQLTLG